MNAFRQALTPARALLLAALLLLAQAAGLAHRVAHGGLVGTAPAATQAAADGHGHGHRYGITDHQQAGAECRLLDQVLGQADLLPTAHQAGAVQPSSATAALAPQACACATSAAGYQARAPPLA